MNAYIVLLKLDYSEETYVNLTTYLKTTSYWARPFPKTWLIKTTRTSAEIRTGVRARINPSDKVLVISVGVGDWASYNLDNVFVEWLKNNL